ncbi:MAG: type I toxin-antitoxin system SymE family toxin [Lachnospiraceae bacterium]|nr:type I toxin-antitoxin system SymE family toxin [Lachnospiraceae bacterium]
MKNVRNLKVCYRSEPRHGAGLHSFHNVYVPSISLSGKWLEQLGFDIDTPIAVECSDGRLVITRRDWNKN